MKRKLYLIILLAAIALSGMAQTIGEAFYICLVIVVVIVVVTMFAVANGMRY